MKDRAFEVTGSILKSEDLLKRAIPVLLWLLIVVVIYHPVIFESFWAALVSDAVHLSIPNNYFAAQELKEAGFPLWNPYINLGQIVFDGNFMPLHPGLILYLLFNPWLANTLMVLTGLFLTGLGAWKFLENLGFGFWEIFVGTLVYVFSGPVFFQHIYHYGLLSLLILPWGLLAFHKYDDTRNKRHLWVAALLCVIAANSSDLDLTVYLYAGFAIDRIVCLPEKGRAGYALTWSGIFVFSLFTTLLWSYPWYLWMRESSRVYRNYEGIITPGFFNFFSAALFHRWLSFFPYDNTYFYFGPAVFWLGAAGMLKFKKNDYTFRFFLLALLFPVFYLISRVFLHMGMRYFTAVDAWKSMPVFCIALAPLAAKGVRNIMAGGRKQKYLALLAAAVFLFAGLQFSRHNYSGPFSEESVLFFAGVFFILVSGAILSAGRKKLLICSIILSASVTLLGNAILRARRDIKTPSIFQPPIQCPIMVPRETAEDLTVYRGIARQPGYGGIRSRAALLNVTDNRIVMAGVPTVPTYTTFYNLNFEQSMIREGLIDEEAVLPYWMKLRYPDSVTLAEFGVRFLIVLRPHSIPENYKSGWVSRPELGSDDMEVWENIHYRGRAYIKRDSGYIAGRVEFRKDTPELVSLSVDAREGDKIVLADLYYPGWQGFVNSEPAETEKYRGSLRAITLTEGKHTVSWRYNRSRERLGAFLSVLSLAGLVLTVNRENRRKRTCRMIRG